MDCRGHEKRLQIAANWNVRPIAHIKLINGKILPGDAGGSITDSYYIFECVHKKTNAVQYIHCGRVVAKDFSFITGEKLPAIFNPLKSGSNESIATCQGQGFSKVKWNKARKQLHDATMLLIITWNAKEGTALFDIKEKIEELPHVPPPLSFVRAINTILGKGHSTMEEIISDLKKENELKDFKFELLIEMLNENDIPQNFR